jgi:hypothetical protein
MAGQLKSATPIKSLSAGTRLLIGIRGADEIADTIETCALLHVVSVKELA